MYSVKEVLVYAVLFFNVFDLNFLSQNSLHIYMFVFNPCHKGLVINYGERGLQNGKIAGPKLIVPPPPSLKMRLNF